jgi:FkbM family methyltransferase
MPTAQKAKQVLKLNEQQWLDLRRQLVQVVKVDDEQFTHRFRCETPYESWRARTLLEKEEGTVRWIRTCAREGDVFYDIGANIGLYTLLAAQRVGPRGMVYAFEPHVANVHSLLANIALNQMSSRVRVLSCALHEAEGFFDFNYYAAEAGTSMSQLNDARDSLDRPFQPAFAEYKYAVTLDKLVADGAIRPADHVKIDVDGNELLVLRGMRGLLCGDTAPTTIQVEINPRYKDELYGMLQQLDYELAEKHFTLHGKKQIAAGADPESIGYNAVFRRRSLPAAA